MFLGWNRVFDYTTRSSSLRGLWLFTLFEAQIAHFIRNNVIVVEVANSFQQASDRCEHWCCSQYTRDLPVMVSLPACCPFTCTLSPTTAFDTSVPCFLTACCTHICDAMKVTLTCHRLTQKGKTCPTHFKRHISPQIWNGWHTNVTIIWISQRKRSELRSVINKVNHINSGFFNQDY